MSKPDVTDFEVCRELIYKIVDFSLARRNELLAQNKINKDQYTEIRKKVEEPLRRQAKDLTLKIYEGIIKSVTGHQTKIATVTTKLEKVISKIDNLNQSITFFSRIINFFGSILTTVSSGLSGIPNLLTNLEAIL